MERPNLDGKLGHNLAQRLRVHPELREIYCSRCEIKFHPYIPRYADTDHCIWCQEEIEAGHVIIGAGLEDAGGYLQVLQDPAGPRKRESNWTSRRKGRCGCGIEIGPRSIRCRQCAQIRRHKKERKLEYEFEIV